MVCLRRYIFVNFGDWWKCFFFINIEYVNISLKMVMSIVFFIYCIFYVMGNIYIVS